MAVHGIVQSRVTELDELRLAVIRAMGKSGYQEFQFDICQAIGEVKPIMKLTADEALKVLAYRRGEGMTA